MATAAESPSSPCASLPEGSESLSATFCVGVDFGSSQSVVASSQPSAPRRTHVEVNRLANRSTPSAFAFDGKLRTVGEEAEARAGSAGGGVFVNFLQLWLGAQSEEEVQKAPLSWVVGHFLRALVSFASQGRSDAAGPGGGFVEIPSSLVVAVPSSWEDGSTRAQLAMREILVGAAALGLPPPVLISKASALLNAWAASHLPSGLRALQELTQKQRQNSEQEREAADPPQVFLAIVDVGFAETSVQILELSEQTAGDEAADAAFSVVPKVLASEADPYLGVSDAVTALARHVCGIVETKHKQQVALHSKKASRLFAACARAVVHLSGLAESSVDIEGFLEDEEDLHVPLSRTCFEEVCAPLKTRLEALVAETLGRSGKSAFEVCAVEVVGGGSRIPWVAQTIDAAFAGGEGSSNVSSKLRRTLDGGSAVAMGAASFAAGLAFTKAIDASALAKELPPTQLEEVAAVEHQVHLAEAAELKRLEKRNLLESFLLEMQSALRGPKASLLGGTDGEANRRLQEKEHWMLDNQEASESEFEATRKELEDFLHTECAAYFAALQDEKKEQEERLEKGAAEAAAVAAASGGRDDVDVKLPPSQCLKRAKKNKEEANELFKDGNTEHAAQRYVKGLQYLAKLYDLPPAEKAESDSLKLSLNLNLAQCYLRLAGTDPSASTFETFTKKAISCCDAALEIDQKNLKALYRRAVAREKIRETEAAMADVQTALSVAPEESDFLKLKDRLELRQRKEKEQQKKVYSRMFS